jgi:lipoprotein-anchoring transpeptidase ErfK/SrfK
VIKSQLAAIALILAAATACSASVAGTGHSSKDVAGAHPARPSHPTTKPLAASAPPTHARRRPSKPVHAGLFEADGQTYGIAMPIIIRFTKPVTDHAAFDKAVSVSVDGTPARGAWDWEASPSPGWAVEAHYRLATFWPAHSHVTVNAPLRGVSAGTGLAFDDNLTLSMNIGAAHISTVDASDADPHMTVTSDGRTVRTPPVSLGDATNPTYRGTKVVEEFDRVEDMEGTPVAWSVRLTNSGEFVHAAPWNSEIGRENLSHGCTNLSTADAEWFYRFSRLGDVVRYPNAPGRLMQATDGSPDNLRAAWRDT